MPDLLPLFLNLRGRRVVLVGAGPVAASKLTQLMAAGADVLVVAPEVHPAIVASGVPVVQRDFEPSDLDAAWLVVAAAPPAINRLVAAAAETRRLMVNAVDDPPNATAYLGGVVRRDGVTVAISTSGTAPGLAGLLREALDAVLPQELSDWMSVAHAERVNWRRDVVPMEQRRPLLLRALNRLHGLHVVDAVGPVTTRSKADGNAGSAAGSEALPGAELDAEFDVRCAEPYGEAPRSEAER